MEAGNGVVSLAEGFPQQVCRLGVCSSFIPGVDIESVALLPTGCDGRFSLLKVLHYEWLETEGKKTTPAC